MRLHTVEASRYIWEGLVAQQADGSHQRFQILWFIHKSTLKQTRVHKHTRTHQCMDSLLVKENQCPTFFSQETLVSEAIKFELIVPCLQGDDISPSYLPGVGGQSKTRFPDGQTSTQRRRGAV